MSGNLLSIQAHPTLERKIRNFPDTIYDFNDGDSLTTLMEVLLGNSGTGQLQNIQAAARIAQVNIEYSNLDQILGQMLSLRRNYSEIYSFATNPFIDQLTYNQWQEISAKDSSYRERLLGAAEAFQLGSSVWALKTMAEAATQMEFYVTESWRNTGGSGRNLGPIEVVFYPLIDDKGIITWDQNKANLLSQTLTQLLACNFVMSFGKAITRYTQYPFSNASAPTTNPYSEFFYVVNQVQASSVLTPSVKIPGSQSRYWINTGGVQTAPEFSHLMTQERAVELTGSIVQVTATDGSSNPSGSVALPGLSVSSTIYGAQ